MRFSAFLYFLILFLLLFFAPLGCDCAGGGGGGGDDDDDDTGPPPEPDTQCIEYFCLSYVSHGCKAYVDVPECIEDHIKFCSGFEEINNYNKCLCERGCMILTQESDTSTCYYLWDCEYSCSVDYCVFVH